MARFSNRIRWRLALPVLLPLVLLVGCSVVAVQVTGTPGAGRVNEGALPTTPGAPFTATSTPGGSQPVPDPLKSGSAIQTAVPSITQTAFSFVAFGDTRSNHIAHQQVVSSILMLAPAFVLHMGDFVEDGRVAAQWTTFFSIEHSLLSQTPLYGVLGNHEHNSSLYFDVFQFPGNERWYSFDYGSVHFVALEIDGYANYAPGSEQFQWLENDLAHTSQPWKVVFFHIPPYSSASHGSDLQVRTVLEPLFMRYGVDLVFNGHDHDYERSVANGIVYIVTGGGGAPLYSKSNPNPASVYFTSTYHSVVVSVTDSLLSLAGVRSDGIRFDGFTLRQPTFRHYVPVVIR